MRVTRMTNFFNYLWEALTNYRKLKDEANEMRKEKDFLLLDSIKNSDKLKDLQKQYDLLKAEYMQDILHDQEKEYLSQLEETYPKSVVRYKCRPLPASKENIWVPVNVFITPDDPNIIKDLKKWGLYQTGESRETLVPKIYKKIFHTYYKYQFDEKNFGIGEVWLFPYELREMVKQDKGGDCDDWAHLQSSYYIAAGVHPAFVRCVVGDTNLGAHATVYVHSPETNKFRHVNSTYGSPLPQELSKYPTHDDAQSGKDPIGIHSAWFSYTSKSGYYKFLPGQTEEFVQKFNIQKLG